MKKIIITVVLIVLAIIIGLSIYLSPNDIAGCGEKPSATKECASADAIVTLSGGDTTARTNEAISLYKNGWATKMIFSGAAQDKSGPSNAEVMRRLAMAAGVPESNIITEEYSETTRQNAENTQSIFQQNDISSVILVTSAYHQRRAGLEFSSRASGVALRNHPVSSDNQWSVFWWCTPTGWYLAVSELAKIIAFYSGGSR